MYLTCRCCKRSKLLSDKPLFSFTEKEFFAFRRKQRRAVFGLTWVDFPKLICPLSGVGCLVLGHFVVYLVLSQNGFHKKTKSWNFHCSQFTCRKMIKIKANEIVHNWIIFNKYNFIGSSPETNWGFEIECHISRTLLRTQCRQSEQIRREIWSNGIRAFWGVFQSKLEIISGSVQIASCPFPSPFESASFRPGKQATFLRTVTTWSSTKNPHRSLTTKIPLITEYHTKKSQIQGSRTADDVRGKIG